MSEKRVRVTIRLTEEESHKIDYLFEQSGAKNKSDFLRECIFSGTTNGKYKNVAVEGLTKLYYLNDNVQRTLDNLEQKGNCLEYMQKIYMELRNIGQEVRRLNGNLKNIK